MYRCANDHAFDISKDGYVNLLLAKNRNSKDPGYSKAMIASRRDFFDSGRYELLADQLGDIVASHIPPGDQRLVVDAGCGEGYYLRRLRHRLTATRESAAPILCGIDISKHAVQIAARRDGMGVYAVASTHDLPLLPAVADVLLTHFSPVFAASFRRIVRAGGVVLVGTPGPSHLFHLKQLLYDTPQLHEPNLSLSGEPGFELIDVHRIRYEIALRDSAAISNLLEMTPYYWSASAETQARVAQLDELHTDVDVTVSAYRMLTLPDNNLAPNTPEHGGRDQSRD